MLNQKSIEAVNSSLFSTQFVTPLYDSYSFARIPDTVAQLLLGESDHPLPVDVVGDQWIQSDIVILFLIDGFGWEFFERFRSQYPFLNRYLDQGIASKITSQFPSTTAAHITTMNTGLDVGQSGVYEWFYYEPLIDTMISPLLFSFAGDHQPNTLQKTHITPENFYPKHTLYQKFRDKGIKSYTILPSGIVDSTYSLTLLQGAERVPFSNLQQGLDSVLYICQSATPDPTYIYFYLGNIDGMGHRHGIYSPQFEAATKECWDTLESSFYQKLKGINKNIATIVTADHGMVPVVPKRTYYLNQLYPDLVNVFKKNKQGKPLVPAGSCRDFFLHIEESHLLSVQQQLSHRFKGIAEIYLTDWLIDQGLFGHNPSQEFLQRVGNLVILPYVDESIWWFEKHRFEQHFYAAHGGLTRPEMESIFLFH